jgi:hypothetical protein
MRRFFVVAAVVLLALDSRAARAQGELPVPAEIKKGSPLVGGVYLNVAEVASLELKTARKAIADQDWKAAVQALQAALESPPASVVEVVRKGPDGKEHRSWVGAHAEASRLLASLPKAGLDAYEKRYGPDARRLLDKAKKKDISLLTEVIDRYRFTEAGAEALVLLAERHFADGRFFHAAACYALWQEHRSARVPTSVEFYQMTVAFRRADSPERADKTWKELTDKIGKEKLKIGEEELTLEQTRKRLEREAPLPLARTTTWDRRPQPGGGLPSEAKPLWQRPLVLDDRDKEHDWRGMEANPWLDDSLKAKKGALSPGFAPLIVGDLCLYRSYLDVRAASWHDTKQAKGGELFW